MKKLSTIIALAGMGCAGVGNPVVPEPPRFEQNEQNVPRMYIDECYQFYTFTWDDVHNTYLFTWHPSSMQCYTRKF